MKNKVQTETTSCADRPSLTVVPKKQVPQVVTLPVDDTALPFPLHGYEERIQAPWARAAARHLLANAVSAKISETNGAIKKLKDKVDRLKKIETKGTLAAGNDSDAKAILNMLDSNLEIVINVERLLKKHPEPTDKQWATVLPDCGNNTNIRKTISTICRFLDVPPISGEAWAEARYLRTKEKLLDQHKGSWVGPLLSDFALNREKHQQMYIDRGYTGESLRFRAKHKADALCQVVKVLEFLLSKELIDIREMRQHHLDEFFCRFPGSQPAHITAFTKYLARKGYFTFKFKVPIAKSYIDLNKLVRRSEIEQITDNMLNETEHVQEALLVLFAMYYAQSPTKLIKYPFSEVVIADGEMTIKFGTIDIPLHPVIATKLQEWRVQRKAILATMEITNNDLLFFDAKDPYSQLQIKALNRIFGKNLPKISNLKATAIVNLFQNGVRTSTALSETIGISTHSAVRYMKACAELRLGQANYEWDF